MKKILFFVFVLLTCVLSTNAKGEPGKPFVCDTVIQVPGQSAQQIYDNIKVWFADNMRSSNNVIQLDDANNKHIIGKANIQFKVNNFTFSNLTGVINFKIDVAARDERFRVILSDFEHESYSKGWTEGQVYVGGPNPNVKGMRKIQNSEMQKRAAPLVIDTAAGIIVTMEEAAKGNSVIVEDDW